MSSFILTLLTTQFEMRWEQFILVSNQQKVIDILEDLKDLKKY